MPTENSLNNTKDTTTNNIELSIIIPTYNRLWSLPRTLASCQKAQQINPKIEIIVVDDGSNDGTIEWLNTQKDIVLIKQSNWGKCWAVNTALKYAQGTYIRFLDSDDTILPENNNQQLQLALTKNPDLVVGGMTFINEADQILRSQPWEPSTDFVAQQLGESNNTHYSAYLFKKDFIINIPHRPDLAYRDDRMLCIEAAILQKTYEIYPNTVLYHRQHTKSKLQTEKGISSYLRIQHSWLCYKKAYELLNNQNQLTARRKKVIVNILWEICQNMATINPDEAKKIYSTILTLNPKFKPKNGNKAKIYNVMGYRLAITLTSLIGALKRAIQ